MKRLCIVALALVGACASSKNEGSASPQQGGEASPQADAKAQKKADNATREHYCQFNGGDALQQSASFDLNCPPPQITCQVLQRVGMFGIAARVGVRGCGRQASYARMPNGLHWLINGGVVNDPTYQPQQPPPQQ